MIQGLNEIPIGFGQDFPHEAYSTAVPGGPVPALPAPIKGPISAYDRMIRIGRGLDSISPATKRAMERDQNRARIYRERTDKIRATGNLPTYGDHTPQQDLDALKYGVPLGPYQYNMPGPKNTALSNKLARADAALANTQSAGTSKMRSNPRTVHLARFQNMVAADAAQPKPAPVVREWDQALMDKIHNRNSRAPMVDGPAVQELQKIEQEQGGGPQLFDVPPEPRAVRGKPEVGSPAWKSLQRMRQSVADELGDDPANIDDETMRLYMSRRHSKAKGGRNDIQSARQQQLLANRAQKREAKKSGGATTGGDRYHNVFMLGLQTGNTDLMNKALEGYTESEKTKALTDAAAEDRKLKEKDINGQADDRKLEREKGDQQFQLMMKRMDAEQKAREAEAKRQEMAGNHGEAARQRQHAETIAQMQAQMAQNDQHHKERIAAEGAKNRPLTQDEKDAKIRADAKAAGVTDPAQVEEHVRQARETDAQKADAPVPPSRVERDMAAGKLTDEAYNEMRALHPTELWHPDWNPFIGEEQYKDKLFRHFNSLYPNVPPAMMKSLVGRYFIRHRAE